MRFSDIVGHSEVKEKLLQSFHQDRIPHAQLFLGKEGSNGLALALALVQLIYCKNPTETDSCGECSSCVKNQKLTHPDVHYCYPTAAAKELSTKYIENWRTAIIEDSLLNSKEWLWKIAKDENKTGVITREETKDILGKLSLKPYEGIAKTLIIWLPEFLEKTGNSLLKVIEEPPNKTYFILVSENQDKILPTILSRTQLTKIPAYSDDEIKLALKDKYDLEQNILDQIAFLAEGNLKKAYQMVHDSADNYASYFRTYLQSCFKNDLLALSSQVDDLAKMGRTQIIAFLQSGLKILRECLMYNVQDNYTIRFAEEYSEFIKRLSVTLNASLIEQSYEQINNSIYYIGRNSNAKITLFNLALGLRHNFIRKK